jgi:hypothetical protein
MIARRRRRNFEHTDPAEVSLEIQTAARANQERAKVRAALTHPTGSLVTGAAEREAHDWLVAWADSSVVRDARRGTFGSVRELIAAITEYLHTYNAAPTRFVWTKDADMILGKIRRCKEALGTPH